MTFRSDPALGDPCDEWPRELVLKAVGLRLCGHAVAIGVCMACKVEAYASSELSSPLGLAMGVVTSRGKQIMANHVVRDEDEL